MESDDSLHHPPPREDLVAYPTSRSPTNGEVIKPNNRKNQMTRVYGGSYSTREVASGRPDSDGGELDGEKLTFEISFRLNFGNDNKPGTASSVTGPASPTSVASPRHISAKEMPGDGVDKRIVLFRVPLMDVLKDEMASSFLGNFVREIYWTAMYPPKDRDGDGLVGFVLKNQKAVDEAYLSRPGRITVGYPSTSSITVVSNSAWAYVVVKKSSRIHLCSINLEVLVWTCLDLIAQNGRRIKQEAKIAGTWPTCEVILRIIEQPSFLKWLCDHQKPQSLVRYFHTTEPIPGFIRQDLTFSIGLIKSVIASTINLKKAFCSFAKFVAGYRKYLEKALGEAEGVALYTAVSAPLKLTNLVPGGPRPRPDKTILEHLQAYFRICDDSGGYPQFTPAKRQAADYKETVLKDSMIEALALSIFPTTTTTPTTT